MKWSCHKSVQNHSVETLERIIFLSLSWHLLARNNLALSSAIVALRVAVSDHLAFCPRGFLGSCVSRWYRVLSTWSYIPDFDLLLLPPAHHLLIIFNDNLAKTQVFPLGFVWLRSIIAILWLSRQQMHSFVLIISFLSVNLLACLLLYPQMNCFLRSDTLPPLS